MIHSTIPPWQRLSRPRLVDRTPFSRRSHPALTLLALLGLLLVCTSVSAQPDLEESDFPLADWTAIGPFASTDDVLMMGSFDFRRAMTGGNPGAFLETDLLLPTVSAGSIAYWVALISDTLSWNPSETPLERIDFDIDGLRGDGPGNRIFTLAVQQGDFVWGAVTRRFFLTEDGWTPLSLSCLTAEDFDPMPLNRLDGQPDHPDFSASGGPLNFGLLFGQSCPSSSDCRSALLRTLGVDNFQVTVNGTFQINQGISDAWDDPNSGGQGMYVSVFPHLDALALAWFTYDVDLPADGISFTVGDPGHRWITAFGEFCGDTAELDLQLTRGGRFDQAEPVPEPAKVIGSATIQWSDCNNATFDYDLPDLDLAGRIDLVRAVGTNDTLCEALSIPEGAD